MTDTPDTDVNGTEYVVLVNGEPEVFTPTFSSGLRYARSVAGGNHFKVMPTQDWLEQDHEILTQH